MPMCEHCDYHMHDARVDPMQRAGPVDLVLVLIPLRHACDSHLSENLFRVGGGELGTSRHGSSTIAHAWPRLEAFFAISVVHFALFGV